MLIIFVLKTSNEIIARNLSFEIVPALFQRNWLTEPDEHISMIHL